MATGDFSTTSGWRRTEVAVPGDFIGRQSEFLISPDSETHQFFHVVTGKKERKRRGEGKKKKRRKEGKEERKEGQKRRKGGKGKGNKKRENMNIV